MEPILGERTAARRSTVQHHKIAWSDFDILLGQTMCTSPRSHVSPSNAATVYQLNRIDAYYFVSIAPQLRRLLALWSDSEVVQLDRRIGCIIIKARKVVNRQPAILDSTVLRVELDVCAVRVELIRSDFGRVLHVFLPRRLPAGIALEADVCPVDRDWLSEEIVEAESV